MCRCLCECVNVHVRMCCYLQRPEEGVRSSGTGVIDICELPHEGSGNQILGPLQEQKMFLLADGNLHFIFYDILLVLNFFIQYIRSYSLPSS